MRYFFVFCAGLLFAPALAEERDSKPELESIKPELESEGLDFSKENLLKEIKALEPGQTVKIKLKDGDQALKNIKKTGFIETGRLSLRPQLAYFPPFMNDNNLNQMIGLGQISINFTRPIITADGRLKWLIGGGLGAMRILKRKYWNEPMPTEEPYTCPRHPRAGFISEFFRPEPPSDPAFQETYRQKLNEYNQRRAEVEAYKRGECPADVRIPVENKPAFYFFAGAQTGLVYDLDWMSASVEGGAFLDNQKTLGWTGRLSLGGDITEMVKWQAGVSAVLIDPDLYWAGELAFSATIKSWFVRF